MGIRYDFNDGARVLLPKGKWHVQIEDDETDNIIFACDADEGWVLSTKKYYIPFRIRVWVRGEKEPVLNHTLNLTGKEVQIKFPVGTLGDIIGWMTYADRFQQKHKCAAEITMAHNLAEIFEGQYPNLFFTHLPGKVRFEKPYASYMLGLFFKGNDTHQPIDFRKVGLHRTAGYILGVDPREEAPKVKLGSPRKIKERYVCIATKSSSQAKFWNNGYGWEQVVAYLKELGYRVICIDKEPVTGFKYTWNRMPHEAEDFTGNKPLQIHEILRAARRVDPRGTRPRDAERPQPALAASRRQNHGFRVEEKLGTESCANDELSCALVVDAQHRYAVFADHTSIDDGLLLHCGVFGAGKLGLHTVQAEAVVHTLLEHAARALLAIDHGHASRARTSRAHSRRHTRSATADDDHVEAALDPRGRTQLASPHIRRHMSRVRFLRNLTF